MRHKVTAGQTDRQTDPEEGHLPGVETAYGEGREPLSPPLHSKGSLFNPLAPPLGGAISQVLEGPAS